MAVIVRIGVAARAVVIDDGADVDRIDREQIADARCPDIARPRRAEEKVAKEARGRSEEHTSELQSLMRISYAVFCLKKKKKKHQLANINITNITHIRI